MLLSCLKQLVHNSPIQEEDLAKLFYNFFFLTFQIEIDKDLPVLLNKAVDSAISDEEFLLDWNTTYNLAKAYESIISPKNKELLGSTKESQYSIS